MSYQTDDGRHEGWAAAEFPDGRISVGSGPGGTMVRRFGPKGVDYDAEPDFLDGRTTLGWRGVCECGWRGLLWERVATPAEHDIAARRVYDGLGIRLVGGKKTVDLRVYGDAPSAVEDAIHKEWKGHLEPASVTAVREAADELRAAQARLDAAVRAARADGQSLADLRKAAEMTDL